MNKEIVRKGEFAGMRKKDIVPHMRSKTKYCQTLENIKIDNSVKHHYRLWEPKEDICRSFFLWKGKYSYSPKEKEIAHVLHTVNMRYYREVSFDTVKRFDFYLPLIDLVVEYDGAQHFQYFKEIQNDIQKEKLLARLGVKYIRYNKSHDLAKQIPYDLIHHPVLKG